MTEILQQKIFERFDIFDMSKGSCMKYGLSCGDGWFQIVWDLCEEIENDIKENSVEGFHVKQVKEKFGGLRFYFNCNPEKDFGRIKSIVEKYEKKSIRTCEFCAKDGVMTYGDMIQTLCPGCAKNRGHKLKKDFYFSSEYIKSIPKKLLEQYDD